MAAGGAQVEVPAEDGCPAGLDGAHHFELLRCQCMALPIRLAMSAKNIRDLQPRPPLPALERSRLLSMHRLLREEPTVLGLEHVERTFNPPNVAHRHLGVASRGLDRRMTEQALDGPNVVA